MRMLSVSGGLKGIPPRCRSKGGSTKDRPTGNSGPEFPWEAPEARSSRMRRLCCSACHAPCRSEGGQTGIFENITNSTRRWHMSTLGPPPGDRGTPLPKSLRRRVRGGLESTRQLRPFAASTKPNSLMCAKTHDARSAESAGQGAPRSANNHSGTKPVKSFKTKTNLNDETRAARVHDGYRSRRGGDEHKAPNKRRGTSRQWSKKTEGRRQAHKQVSNEAHKGSKHPPMGKRRERRSKDLTHTYTILAHT